MDIKKFRKAHKVSQSDLSALFECSQGHISNIESGERNLTPLQFRLLIEKYGFDKVSPFIEDDDPVPASITVNAPNISHNSAPVQNGDGNHMMVDDRLIRVLEEQSKQLTKSQEQQDRLITLLEKLSAPK